MGLFYTVIEASEEQKNALLDKHLKFRPRFFNKDTSPVVQRNYTYNEEVEIGFVSLILKSGKRCSYQFRRGIPCFVEFTGFGDIRYDVHYPSGEMYEILKREGDIADNNFWKCGEI